MKRTVTTLRTDVASFPGSGRGRVRVPAEVTLCVSDDEADTLEAEVISVAIDGRQAEIRLRWDRVLHKA